MTGVFASLRSKILQGLQFTFVRLLKTCIFVTNKYLPYSKSVLNENATNIPTIFLLSM